MKFTDIPKFTESGTWECSYSLDRFVKQIENFEKEEKLEMNPDFQRGYVWTGQQQVAFIEYILRGGKSGRTIYLNNTGWDTSEMGWFVCVDGLQRTTAIRRFMNNEIKAFGLHYSDFEGSVKLLDSINININGLKTRKEVLQWYIEMNRGGTVHTEEEINKVKELLEKEELSTC